MTSMLEEVSNYIVATKYARYNEELGRRETWEEAVGRLEDMHLRKFSHLEYEQLAEIRKAFDLVREKRVVPSMRSIQYGGIAIEAHNARLFNCAVRHVDSIRSFSELFYLLLAGCGTGIGLSERFLKRLPKLTPHVHRSDLPPVVYVIDDTIEGWADSLEVLLSTYMENTPYTGRRLDFDYSYIREKGAALKVGGGKAPGYEPLEASHQKIRRVIENAMRFGYDRLRTIDAYDILMHAADAVLSGGVRRSATAVIFDKDDELMLNAKTGNWWETEPQRARSNNSVLLVRNQVSPEEFEQIMTRTQEWGEPGFVFADEKDILFNPSLRGDTRVLTDQGIFPIKELEGKEFRVPNLFGEWSEANCRLSGRGKKLFKVTLVGGHEYYATAEHKWPVVTAKGFEKRTTLELNAGDKLPTYATDKLHDGELGDYDDGFLIGWLYGDGWITDRKDNGKRQYGLIVSKSDVESGVLKKLQSILDEKIVKDGRPITFTERENGCSETNFQRVSADEYFRSFGVDKKELGLPSAAWLGSEEFRKGFVDGLFSSDGSVNKSSTSSNRTLAFSSSREKLTRDLSDLLGFYGVQNTVHHGKIARGRVFPNGKSYDKEYDIWALYISRGASISHFNDVFQLSHEEKARKYFDLVEMGDGHIWSKSSSIRIQSVEETSQYEDVWDLSVFDRSHCFRLAHAVTGNCFEVSFLPITDSGETGVQFCNLSSINGGKVHSAEDFYQYAEAAALIGTLQATYTDFKYLSDTAKELTEAEALLGVSITAMMENPDIILDPEVQRKGAEIVKTTNKRWAAILGINPAARCCVIKPEGTSTLALGSMASGIHPAHSRHLFRRINANKLDPASQFFAQFNPHMVEESVTNPNGTDWVITFPVKVPDHAMVKSDLSALEHLEIIKSTQQNWVMSGTSEFNKKNVTHNVSCTVIVKDDEWEQVTDYLFAHQDAFAAVSFISEDGDKKYAQAPFEAVSTDEDWAKYNALLGDYIPVDYSYLLEATDNTSVAQEVACGGGACEIIL